MTVSAVYITCRDVDEARRIGSALVESRLAACANILPAMESIYWWQGTLEQAHEAVLIVKTRAVHVRELTRKVKELHSYEVPCVVAFPVEGGNEDFLSWVKKETK